MDGPEVTIDYYGDKTGGSNYGLNGATFNFAKMSTIKYSLNGTETIIKKGITYTTVSDSVASSGEHNSFVGTKMSILGGTNGNSLNAIRTSSGGTITTKPIQNEVTTGWMPDSGNLVSDILTLHGMSQTLADGKTDEYVLSMSYLDNPRAAGLGKAGELGIVTMNDQGEWVNAVSQDFATTQKYVAGPWNSSYKLGTWGVDTVTHTAWAVINFNGDFAVGTAATNAR